MVVVPEDAAVVVDKAVVVGVVVVTEEAVVVEELLENNATIPITTPTITIRPPICLSLLVLLTCLVCWATFCCR